MWQKKTMELLKVINFAVVRDRHTGRWMFKNLKKFPKKNNFVSEQLILYIKKI
jgi:hypothetical protein